MIKIIKCHTNMSFLVGCSTNEDCVKSMCNEYGTEHKRSL